MSNRPAYTLAQMSFSVACLYAICGHCGHFGVISLGMIRKIGQGIITQQEFENVDVVGQVIGEVGRLAAA